MRRNAWFLAAAVHVAACWGGGEQRHDGGTAPHDSGADAGEPGDAGGSDAGVEPPQGLVELTMRDGVPLNTWFWVPQGPGPFPIFLVRNPYAGLNNTEDLEPYARFFTARGMALVWQATRGTGGSGGVFVPYVSEVDDAKDTITWLVDQPFCNGRIATGGGSYLGYTAFAAAAADPHVVLVLSDDTAADEEMTRHMGVVNGYLLSWWSLVERERLATDEERRALTNGLVVTDADQSVLGRDLPYWNDLMAAGTAVYPPQASLQVLAQSICTPALHILEGDTPWNDPRLTWDAVNAQGCPAHRDHQWLVVAPEGHSHHFSAFGLADTWVTPDMLTLLEAFLLQTREAPTWSKVRYRVESDEPTRTAALWPPVPTLTSTFFLGAPGPSGEGTLSADAPPAGTWTMESTPATTDPCALPTATWFTSSPLEEDLVLIGAPVLHLPATTTAADFDVHVDLYDYLAGPEEYRNLGTGAVRARYRTGQDTPLDSSAPMDIRVELTASARRVPAGHALTLSVAPSRCEYAENPHTGEPAHQQTQRRAASVGFVLGLNGATLVMPQVP